MSNYAWTVFSTGFSRSFSQEQAFAKCPKANAHMTNVKLGHRGIDPIRVKADSQVGNVLATDIGNGKLAPIFGRWCIGSCCERNVGHQIGGWRRFPPTSVQPCRGVGARTVLSGRKWTEIHIYFFHSLIRKTGISLIGMQNCNRTFHIFDKCKYVSSLCLYITDHLQESDIFLYISSRDAMIKAHNLVIHDQKNVKRYTVRWWNKESECSNLSIIWHCKVVRTVC